MHEGKTLTLRVDLNEKTSTELKRLKEKWGFHSYAEAVRRLITDRASHEGLSVKLDWEQEK